MRRTGMLGGMSWESTAEYYRVINAEVGRRLGGLHSARIVLASVDFAEVEALQAAGEWERAGELLAREAELLQAGGADLLELCTNTMHRVADAIEKAVRIPLLHLGDVTAQAVHGAGLTRVGLLGTAFTMAEDFYVGRLAGHGLDVLVPEAPERADVHRIIFDELCRGEVRGDSRTRVLGMIDGLVAGGARGVELGCAELKLLVDHAVTDVPLFPTARLHGLAAVDATLDGF